MTGSLVVKRDIYQIVLSYKNKQGDWRKKWISTGLSAQGNNKRKAEKLLRDTLTEYEQQDMSVLTDDTLFVDYVEVWKDAARMRIEAVTYEGYVQTLKTHIIPYFKERRTKLRDMSTPLIQQFYAEKMERGRIRGEGGLSGATVKHFHNIIRQVLTHALKAGLIAKHPCDDVLLPKIQKVQGQLLQCRRVKGIAGLLR